MPPKNPIRRYFITGLLVWVPIVITVWVLSFLVGTMDQTLLLLPHALRPESWLGLNIPGLGALLTLLVIFLTGLFAANILGQRLVRYWERVMGRIPVVNSIYNGVKQVSDTLFSPTGQAFRKALLVQWPSPGMWTIAFQTGRPGGDVTNHLQGDYVSIYVPTTPNPTGGYFVMVPRSAVIELDMSVDDALKYIISMGVVAPGRGRRTVHPPGPRARIRAARAGDQAGTGASRQPLAGPRPAFQVVQIMRSEYCGLVSRSHLGQTVTLCGWVHRRRDHGGVIFVDLRDREGLVQIVCDPDTPETFAVADKLRGEFVVAVTGRVRERPQGTVNPTLVSGEIEVLAKQIEILNPSLPPPFQMDDEHLSETVRLEHRFLDLRRPQMQKNLRLRYRTTMAVRKFLDREGFIDIETPMLTRSTPEGARDYLVPSRVHPGHFYALPQSPQLFKQLLMVSGFDRYYQIVKCFRDEDLRADRQPEFTQIDVETSFLSQNEIVELMEALVREVFKEVLEVDLPKPFPRMGYDEAIRRYGSDKPDLRIALELTELTDAVKDVEFKVFRDAARAEGGRVAALRVPGGGALTRSEIDGYTEFVKIYGAKGLAYIKVNSLPGGAEGLQSPILKFLAPEAIQQILERTGAADGDLIFFGADKAKVVNDALGALRLKVGHERGLATPGWRPLWVLDFPMFEWLEEEKRWGAMHHPFTSPADGHDDLLETNPAAARAKAHDIVLNGWELGGGSIRIHRSDVQSKVFRALNIGPDEAQAKFGFLLDALQYGAPPHGGIAFGLDRMTTLMAGEESIRDLIAFPKTQRAQDLLTRAPNTVDEAQLRELHIRLRQPVDKA